MKLFQSLLFSVLFVSAIFFTGCNEEPTTAVNNTSALSKLTLPAGAVITNATFNIYVEDPSGNNFTVHKVNVPWTEAETWNTFFANPPAQFDPASLGNFIGSAGLHTVDITALVQAWINGTTPNNGVLLNQPVSAAGFTVFRSSNYIGTNQPFLEVTYTVNGGTPVTVQETAFADTYIWSIEPDNSFGDEQYLRMAHIDDYRKYALVKFDIEGTPSGGCTLTPGYWKTHSEFGPAPYDDTWAQLPNGASTPFFLSGKTYYQVLWTSPAGNAYYNLSFHYIAAGLNFMNGADPGAAQAAYNSATVLFNTYTPAQIAALSGSNTVRKQFINLAGILGQYNEGYIGPGHCD